MPALNDKLWKRYFSVPCALVDQYLKLATEPALKLILYLLASEGEPSDEKIMEAAGLNRQQLDEAYMHWQALGVIDNAGDHASPAQALKEAERQTDDHENTKQNQPDNTKIGPTRLQPKDITEKLKSEAGLKDLFVNAEQSLGRLLKHSDHIVLIYLRDYLGFDDQSIILILSHCRDLGKTSPGYYETVGKSLFEKGCTDFHAIEEEFMRLGELHSFESKVKHDFGIDIKLSQKQSKLISSWKDMGFGIEMISLAREKCVDATNKLSFPYIDKILKSWNEKGIKDVASAMNEQKPETSSKERSFDIDEFDQFTLGGGQ